MAGCAALKDSRLTPGCEIANVGGLDGLIPVYKLTSSSWATMIIIMNNYEKVEHWILSLVQACVCLLPTVGKYLASRPHGSTRTAFTFISLYADVQSLTLCISNQGLVYCQFHQPRLLWKKTCTHWKHTDTITHSISGSPVSASMKISMDSPKSVSEGGNCLFDF